MLQLQHHEELHYRLLPFALPFATPFVTPFGPPFEPPFATPFPPFFLPIPPTTSPFFALTPSADAVPFCPISRSKPAFPTFPPFCFAFFSRPLARCGRRSGSPIFAGRAAFFAERMDAPIAPVSPRSLSSSSANLRRLARRVRPDSLSRLGYTFRISSRIALHKIIKHIPYARLPPFPCLCVRWVHQLRIAACSGLQQQQRLVRALRYRCGWHIPSACAFSLPDWNHVRAGRENISVSCSIMFSPFLRSRSACRSWIHVVNILQRDYMLCKDYLFLFFFFLHNLGDIHLELI
jgi:hypothetical protein